MSCMQIEGSPDSNPLGSNGENAPTPLRRVHPPLPIEKPVEETDPELRRQLEEWGTDGGWDHRVDGAQAA